MTKICDNKSVGIIIRQGDKFAMIKRKNFPVAYAFVAGHLDSDTFEKAAVKESKEEADITVFSLKKKLEDKFYNPCRRENGSWHDWQVFEADRWAGELKSGSDAKEAFWATRDDLVKLAERTLYFSTKLDIPLEDLAQFIPAVTKDSEWQKDPGLEPVWLVMLRKIGVL